VTLPDSPLPSADAPIDELDVAILADVRDLFAAADPVPGDLVDRVLFAVALADFDLEVCQVHAASELAMAGDRAEEPSRTITFDGDSLTVMVTVNPTEDGTVRLDGWLAPAAAFRVELRTVDGLMSTTADDGGRFVLDHVPHGLAQLVVRPSEDALASGLKGVVTPSIVL
jgi:hypothetical protein